MGADPGEVSSGRNNVVDVRFADAREPECEADAAASDPRVPTDTGDGEGGATIIRFPEPW